MLRGLPTRLPCAVLAASVLACDGESRSAEPPRPALAAARDTVYLAGVEYTARLTGTRPVAVTVTMVNRADRTAQVPMPGGCGVSLVMTRGGESGAPIVWDGAAHQVCDDVVMPYRLAAGERRTMQHVAVDDARMGSASAAGPYHIVVRVRLSGRNPFYVRAGEIPRP